jgi:putative transcriptional regulator
MTILRSMALLLPLTLSVVCASAAPRTPSGSEVRPARGRLLVASRRLGDPNFARTVVLLVEYDDTGAMGVVVNRPTSRSLQDLRAEVKTRRTDTIYLGGPVLLSSMLVLMQGKTAPRDGIRLFADVHVLASRRAVEGAFASKLPQRRVRFYAGHAGWRPGQLDAELRQGDWHVMAAAPDAVFGDAPGRLWERLIATTEGEWTRRPPPALRFTRAAGVPPERSRSHAQDRATRRGPSGSPPSRRAGDSILAARAARS